MKFPMQTEASTQMTDNDSAQTAMIGDEEVALDAIAGIDMDAVEAVHSTATPAGLYHFKVKDCKLDTREANAKDATDPNRKVMKPVIPFELEILNCFGLKDPKQDPAAQIGKNHYETFWITDLAQDIGRVKALMQDSGFEGSGTLTELLDQFVGFEFVAAIKNRKDKNDADIIYANIDGNKVRPYTGEEAA